MKEAWRRGLTLRLERASLLSNFNVIGWEESVRAPTHTPPPALVNHLDVGDDVVWVKGNLIITRWGETEARYITSCS